LAGLCGECDACCRVFEVRDETREFNKPFGVPCKFLGHTVNGPGCTTYTDRPDACYRYVCLWLDSQRRPEVESYPDELRPDRTKVVMGWPWGIDREALYVYPMPGYEDNWRIDPVATRLKLLLSRGAKIIIMLPGGRLVLRGDMAIRGTEKEFEALNA
jgi:hypothetical protein